MSLQPPPTELRSNVQHILDRARGRRSVRRRRRPQSPARRSPAASSAGVTAHTGRGRRRRSSARAQDAFAQWRTVPAPVRGELVRELGELLREHKDDLGALVSIEAGKIRSEGLGEVQEMIDICDFAVGLSRQLFGLTIASERPGHRMMEQWHPLGVVGVISAFNFPVAVWSWNAALALVCGDPVVWKPSEKTLLTALACQALIGRGRPPRRRARAACRRSCSAAPRSARRWSTTRASRWSRPPARPGWAARSRRGSPAASAGCCSSSAATTPRSSRRRADLDLAVRGIVFSAAGTAGQRCTTLRRVIVHCSIADELVDAARRPPTRTLPIGSPLRRRHAGRPADRRARPTSGYASALDKAQADGGELIAGGERVLADEAPGRLLRPAGPRADADADRDRAGRDVRADPLRADLRRLRRGARACTTTCRRACRRRSSPLNVREAERFLVGRRLRLRHRQRQHRPVRRRDRRRVRRREGDRRRPRVRLGRLEGLHAPRHQHGQLLAPSCRWPRASSSAERRLARVGPSGSITPTGHLRPDWSLATDQSAHK